jgi:hypothetical protein
LLARHSAWLLKCLWGGFGRSFFGAVLREVGADEEAEGVIDVESK